MRVRHAIKIAVSVMAAASIVIATAVTAMAQVEITPQTSITPTSKVTTWIFQMAIATAVLGVLVLIVFALGYLRFAPKFYGREEKRPPLAPGARPASLTREAAAVRWTPPAPAPAAAHAGAAPRTATAVAERPAPTTSPAAERATETPTAAPEPAPAAEQPAAATAEPAPAPAPSEVPAAPESAPAPAPASHGGALDQETFDRVLQEQLSKGVDRRVAEGRARAAAVVAARKKGQG